MDIQKIVDYFSFRVATRYLKQHCLYDEVVTLMTRHKSTGVGLMGFAVLYEYVRRYKPQYVLECGTGLSTHIIATAMRRFSEPCHKEIKLISMESEAEWYREAAKHFDLEKFSFAEILLSPIAHYRYSFVDGMVYSETPEYPYDFVFVDGPYYADRCDMDFIKVLQSSKKNLSALIDSRRTSCLAYSALLGRDKLAYYPFGMSYIRNVSKKDLILSNKLSLHHTFNENIPRKYSMFLRGLIASALLCLVPMRWFD